MDRSSNYYKQVQLLMQVLPFVSQHECFALKGGTAINLFVRDLPRLSIDIDLVYLPMKSRTEALVDIRTALDKISDTLISNLAETEVSKSYKQKEDALRLVIARKGVQIKIELSPVLRGTVFKPKVMTVCEAVEDEFGFAEVAVVTLPDLYAGKICAALDRQHPRDLFDVKWLLENEGLTDDIRKALLVYIASHNRPMAELLQPKLKDISAIYEGEFANMAEKDIPLEELLNVRTKLIKLLHEDLTTDEKTFLLSFKNKQPNWNLLGLNSVSELPAIKWKQTNLANMPDKKHTAAYQKLAEVLGN
ncbi:nucleotidyl transferase AbiEii/AbiGii toxin family protein [Pleionea mediterranea]|uniref:Putative nucleotidyltransferase component of viral defense system n=1 Tax=Pleionea mediterranea TaxID=523701 RepID=A0A316FZV5_9GAMM|nr:nucleotidyl transferase AbiEii/AbiGii toxin family protein [Pleionea mediterranea]PWK53912.1 putative nucleotidyltransferase component of viral defense system [Pleionea mediterranea]